MKKSRSTGASKRNFQTSKKRSKWLISSKKYQKFLKAKAPKSSPKNLKELPVSKESHFLPQTSIKMIQTPKASVSNFFRAPRLQSSKKPLSNRSNSKKKGSSQLMPSRSLQNSSKRSQIKANARSNLKEPKNIFENSINGMTESNNKISRRARSINEKDKTPSLGHTQRSFWGRNDLQEPLDFIEQAKGLKGKRRLTAENYFNLDSNNTFGTNMNLSKNPYSRGHSVNMQQMRTSPSNFHTNPGSSQYKSQPKQKIDLETVYDSEKLNETNLVSSNNITSRELSQKNRKPFPKTKGKRKRRSSKSVSRALINQTSLDPNLALVKSPQFPKEKMSKHQSRKKIETIPFEISKAQYRSPNSNTNLSWNSTNQNTKTIKNFVIEMPKGEAKSIQKSFKRAKSRPISRGSAYQTGSSANTVVQRQFKDFYNRHHRSFQKKKKKRVNIGYSKRKRALSSKEIFLGSQLGKGLHLNRLQNFNELYQHSGQNEQVGAIYVGQSHQVGRAWAAAGSLIGPS